MAGPGGAVMADWLALHRLSAEDCRAHLLPALRKDPALCAGGPGLSRCRVLARGAGGHGPRAALGGGGSGADQGGGARGPQPRSAALSPRLHAARRRAGPALHLLPGEGPEFRTILLLAHELGHACQLLASGRPDLPPLLRETAAYLAEEQVCAAIAAAEPERGAVLRALHRARTARIMEREGRALCRALEDPAATYTYGWNYPIARDLAARAARHLTPDAQWRVFTGAARLTELSALPEA